MKAIVDDKIPFIRGQIEQLVDVVSYLRGSDITAKDVRDADMLIVRTRTRVDRQLLENSRVRLVVTATIGYDHLDTMWLDSAGIRWTNCPGCNASSVRQYVHNALLVLDRLHAGLTVGVVGIGHVGSLVAEDLRDCGLDVLLCDPPKFGTPTFDEMDWSEVDILTFHTPLTYDGLHPTHHIADERLFSTLKRRPVIINAARGGIVDETALLQALNRGVVSTAVVDTWVGEPHVNPELLARAAIATPHIAGYSADGKANATRMSLQAVACFLGRPFTLDIQPPVLPDGYSYGSVSDGPVCLYDPRVDTESLKAHPEAFERLRGDYPLRREHV